MRSFQRASGEVRNGQNGWSSQTRERIEKLPDSFAVTLLFHNQFDGDTETGNNGACPSLRLAFQGSYGFSANYGFVLAAASHCLHNKTRIKQHRTVGKAAKGK
jgi:hypothetical protein